MPNKYWVANSPALFNSSNWSTSSGGPPGASTPGSEDNAYFDDQGIGNCDLNNTVDVSNFNVASGYSGSIAQNSYQIAISNDADFSGGCFIGGGAPITIGGNFYLTGTDFTNTDQTLTVGGSFHNSGFFHDSSGTFRVLMSNQDFYPNDASFNSLQLGIEQDTSASYLWVQGHCYVRRDLYLYHGVLRSVSDGTIHVQGNISCDGGYGLWSPINNVPIALDGSGVQVLYADGGIISHLIINKSNSNQVIVRGSSDLNLNGDLIVNDGTFNLNNHDIIMLGNPTHITPVIPESGLVQWFKLEDNGTDYLGGSPISFLYSESYQDAVVNRGLLEGGAWLESNFDVRTIEFYFHTPLSISSSMWLWMTNYEVVFLYDPYYSTFQMQGGLFTPIWTSDPVVLTPGTWSQFKFEFDGTDKWNVYIKVDAFSGSYVLLNALPITYAQSSGSWNNNFSFILGMWLGVAYPDGFDEIKVYGIV